MTSRIPRLLTILAAAAALGGCDKEPAGVPAVDEAPLIRSAAALSSSVLTATATAPTTIQLAWQDNSSNETGFEIHRSMTGSGGPFTLTGVAAPNTTSDVDGSVPPEAEYCYKVRAVRTAGRKTSYGAFSNTACAKTPAAPPTNATATPASSSDIDVSWTDNAPTEDSFRLERSASAAGPWEVAATIAPTQTSYRDAGRTSDQQVCYRVFAFNSDGDSAPSGVDCTAPPLGPTSLVATPGEGQSVDLTWVDNSSVETGYEVRQSDDGVTFYLVAELAPNSTSFLATFDASAIRWYQVRASRDGGFSSPSNIASAERTCAPSEICANGLDDDCDGLTDGFDESCPGCGEGGCSDGYYCNEFNVCVTHCDNGIRDGDEGDVDCGGTCGQRCSIGQHCSVNLDCGSGLCVSGTCQNPEGGL